MNVTQFAAQAGRTELQSSATSASIRLLHIGLALAGFLLLNVVAGTRGFVSADETVAHQQVELLAQGVWTVPVDEPILATERRHHPLESVSWVEGGYAPYAKHPVFPVVLLAGDAVAGRIGRFLMLGLAAALTSAVLATVIERRQSGWWVRGFWLSMAGTALPFHGAVLWAHALGALAVAVAILVIEAAALRRPIRAVWWGSLLAAVLAAVWLRSEAAIFFVVVGVVAAVVAIRRSRAPLLGAGVVVAGGAVFGFFAESTIRAAALGTTAQGALSAPDESLLDIEVRWFLTQLWVTGFSGSAFTLLPFVGLVLLMVEARRAINGSVRPPVLLAAVACYALGVIEGPSMSFLATMPLPMVGIMAIRRRDPFIELVAVSTVIFGAAIVMTSYAAAGGGDWGGRYLFLAVGPIVVVSAEGLARLAAVERRVVGAGLMVSALLLAGMIHDVVSSRRAAAGLADRLAVELDQARDAMGGDDSIIVITDPRVSRLLVEDEVAGRILLAEDQSMLDSLVAAILAEGGSPCIRYVDALNPVVDLAPDVERIGDVAAVALVDGKFAPAEQAFCSGRR